MRQNKEKHRGDSWYRICTKKEHSKKRRQQIAKNYQKFKTSKGKKAGNATMEIEGNLGVFRGNGVDQRDKRSF